MYFVHIVSAKNKQYFYNNANNEPIGPLSLDQLQELAKLGRIGQHTWVMERHKNEWQKFADLLNDVEISEKENARRINLQPAPSMPAAPRVSFPAQPQPIEPSTEIPRPSFAKSRPARKTTLAKDASATENSTTPEKTSNFDLPKIQAIANRSFVSGIANIIVGCVWLSMGFVWPAINFAFCLPPALYTIMTGIFEIIYASNLRMKQAIFLKHARMLAILSAFSIGTGNLLSSILGIKNLTSYNDERVSSFFRAYP